MRLNRRHALYVLGAGAMLSATLAEAQESNQALRIIVPAAPGHGLDILARIIGPKIGEQLGRTVFVDNRVGAGGLVAAQAAARSAPDGNTLFFGFAGTHGIFSSLYKKLPYDPVREFDPIVGLTYSSNVLV